MRINRFIIALCIAVIGWAWSALASGPNFNDTTSKPLTTNTSGNVGIGTTTPQGALVVTNGNVGIGTWTAVNASLETTGLRLIGNGAAAGSVLVSSSTGIGTWMSASTLATSGGGTPGGSSSQLQYNNGGSFDGIVNSNVTASGNLGLGTTLSMNKLDVSGGVGIGTGYAGYRTAPTDGLIVQGNVGIGTRVPYQTSSLAKLSIANSGDASALELYTPSISGQGAFNIVAPLSTAITDGKAFSFIIPGENFARGMFYTDGSYGVGPGSAARDLYLSRRATSTLMISSDRSSTGMANLTVTGNIGIGTIAPSNKLAIAGGVGIGTVSYSGFVANAAPSGGLIIEGNVGMGTVSPQARLVITGGNVGVGTWTAVNASLETTGLRLIGNGAAAGSVLVSSSTGIGTWMSASTLPPAAGAWSTGTGTVYTTTGSDNVGIGTTTPQGGLVITNGNVGIGTFAPTQALDINGNIATSGSGDSYFLGNVGMGTSAPGKALDVSGTIRATDITVGSTGFVVDSSGNVTAVASTTTTGGYTQSGTSANTFTGTSTFSNATKSAIFTGGNVGVGTTTPQGAFTVTNGNVGIGTWAPAAKVHVLGVGGTTYGIYNTHSGPGGSFAASFYTVENGSGSSTYGVWGENTYVTGTGVYGTSSYQSGGGGIGVWGESAGTSSGTGVYALESGSSNAGYALRAYNNSANGWAVHSAGASPSYFNGNIGIGTLRPASKLVVAGGVGIGTGWNSPYVTTTAPTGGAIIEGNVGVGTNSPQTMLAIIGGNVGIGTWTATNGALIVKGGNVGIGTALAPTTLSVKGSISQVSVDLTDAATVATDASLGNHFRVTLGGNRTLGNPTNATDGQRVVWELIQDATGSRTITLDTKFQLGTDIASVTLTTTASKRDFLTAIYNVSTDKWYVVGFVKGY